MDRVQHLMDLSANAPAARRKVAAETITHIFELLARVEMPGEDDIPDVAAFAGGGPLVDQPPKWRVPGTAVVIERAEEGTSAGEFLISDKTVASARKRPKDRPAPIGGDRSTPRAWRRPFELPRLNLGESGDKS